MYFYSCEHLYRIKVVVEYKFLITYNRKFTKIPLRDFSRSLDVGWSEIVRLRKSVKFSHMINTLQRRRERSRMSGLIVGCPSPKC